MCVEAVDGVEPRGEFRALRGEIGFRTAAEEKNIDFLAKPVEILESMSGSFRIGEFERGWIAPCENCFQLHLRRLLNGFFGSFAEVSVTGNSDSNRLID